MELYSDLKIKWNFKDKWMEIENIMLSELTQPQKDKYQMFFPNCEYQL